MNTREALDHIEHLLFPGQGESYANEVARLYHVIEQLTEAYKRRDDECQNYKRAEKVLLNRIKELEK